MAFGCSFSADAPRLRRRIISLSTGTVETGRAAAFALFACPAVDLNTLAATGNGKQDDDAAGTACDGFAERVIDWQSRSGRHDLPWQNTRDAYRIWLSEIMLQQTQVHSVRPYYLRFLAHFPNLPRLAAAPLDEVLALWSGLGYYARARHLQRCAQVLVAEYGGRFPDDPALLAGLPGIGRSTAAAIAVFAFGKRAAILDGNVKRVLARSFAIEGHPSEAPVERRLWTLAESLLPTRDIERYTQGMMDLGATLCTRLRPQCSACPLQTICRACRDGRQAELPTRRAGKVLPQQQQQVLLLTDGRQVLLERRPPQGIWGGLLALPEGTPEEAAAFAQRQACELLHLGTCSRLNHAFSHFRLTLEVQRCNVRVLGQAIGEDRWQWLAVEAIATAALPTPIRKILLAELAGDPAADAQALRPIAQRPKATPQAKVTKPADQPSRVLRPKPSRAMPKATGPTKPPAKPIVE